MRIKFTKMHGIGNDYVYVDCFKTTVAEPEKLAVAVSDRHKGIGSDGLVLICPSDVADAKMRMFNLDGSEGKMCGNAIRCVAKYLVDEGYTDKNLLHIETLSGIKRTEVFKENGVVKTVSVEMGKATTEPERVPVRSLTPIVNEKRTFGGREYAITAVSVGNPHCVTFVGDLDSLDIEKIGRSFENSELFPERVNTEFVKILGRNEIAMRVFERGSGETLACGTGACAAVYACALIGLVERDTKVRVKLLGGELEIVCRSDDTLLMIGGATRVFDGEYYYEY